MLINAHYQGKLPMQRMCAPRDETEDGRYLFGKLKLWPVAQLSIVNLFLAIWANSSLQIPATVDSTDIVYREDNVEVQCKNCIFPIDLLWH